MKVTQQSLRSSLDHTLLNHNVDETEKGNLLRSEIISSLQKEFTSWCPSGKLFPVGSYRLGVHSPDSDIDIVCIAPLTHSRLRFQVDFFSRLQSLPGVSYTYGIFRAKVPLIKLIYKSIRIDLQFANSDLDVDDLPDFSIDESSLLSINAVRNTEILLTLVPDCENFRVLLKAIRLWAKKKSLYSSVLGYLGGAAWSILCAKICIQYPMLSAVELIHMFFKVYSIWDWSLPVCLNADDSGYVFASQSGLMSILTPAQPRYNSAYTLTLSSFLCIKQELELACKIVKDVVEGSRNWQALFEDVDFFQQYRYFVRVCVNAASENEYEAWSGLVFSRVKGLLLELESVYPRPMVVFYNRAFEGSGKRGNLSVSYFIGLNFSFGSSVKVDLRGPISNFCNGLNEVREKSSMNLRVRFLHRKDLVGGNTRQILKS
jgi:poly(A) polymerase